MNVGPQVNKLLFFIVLVILYGLDPNFAQGQVVVPDQIIPNGTLSNSVIFPGSGCVYNWANSNPGIGLAASGTGNILSFKGVNTGTTPITATITATPASSGFAYITDDGSNSVAVISTLTHTVTTTIPVGVEPWGVAVNHSGTYVYIANASQTGTVLNARGSVSVIDASANVVIATIPTDETPLNLVVSPDDSKVYVGNINSGTVSVINTSTNSVESSIFVSAPGAMAISPDGKWLYVVSNDQSNQLNIINTANNAIVNTISLNGQPIELAISPDGTKIYTSNQTQGTITVISLSTNSIAATIPVPGTPYGLTITPDGSKIYVADQLLKSVEIINTLTNSVSSTIQLNSGSPVGIFASPDGKEVYIATQAPGLVYTINTSSNSITNTIALGADGAIALGNFISSGSGCNSSPITFKITVNPPVSAPKFTYPTPDNYTKNTPITPIGPATLGGPVPATTFGSVSTLAGDGNLAGYKDGTGAAALFTSLWGIDADASGNLIVADGAEIRKVTPAGVVTTLAGGPPNGVTSGPGFRKLAGLIVLPSGNVIVGDIVNHNLWQLTPGGVVTNLAGAALINFDPTGLAKSPSGDIFVTDQANEVVRDFNTGGNSSIYAGTLNTVGSINASATTSTFYDPTDLKVDEAGDIFVVDQSNNMIRGINADGTVKTVAGQTVTGLTNGPIATALFNKPIALAVDLPDNVYVSDWNGHVIRMIDANGYVISVAGDVVRPVYGDGIGGTASFVHVSGLVYSNGVLYAADRYSVRKIIVTGYTIDKTLPFGLEFDGTTGIISGTPTVLSPATQYTITGYNTGGSYSTTITLGVDPPPPPVITYPTPEVYTRNTAIAPLVPNTGAGGTPSSTTTSAAYTIDKPLPLGLILNPTTGIISGTPSVISLPTDYTITAHNDGGTGTFIINITVVAPILNNAIITFNALPVKTYGDADFDPGATSDNTGEPIVYNSDDPTVATIVNGQIHITGAGTANITATQPGDNNYDAAYPVVQPFTVKPFPLTITADDQTRYFGQPNPAFTFSYSPFAYNENASNLLTPPIGSTTATQTSAPGQYVINTSGATSVNYTITQLPGTLTVLQTLPTVVIPNAFTPNGDGINDLWNIKSIEAYPKCIVSVYSRYGTLVYQSKGYPRSWDGTSNGTPVPTGTYYYIISLNEGDSKPLTGYIAVIR